jgi:RNA polymerase sigma-70 factor (sigma-E family)
VDGTEQREFRDYVASRQAALFKTALLMTGHRQQAEDLVQSALTKLAQHWRRASRFEHLDAYVRRMMYHEQISWWRRWGRHQDTGELPNQAAPGDAAANAVLRLTLAQALRRLSTQQRAAAVLRYYMDLPEVEVAQVMGCSVGTVRSHTGRALARLRQLCPDLDITAKKPEEAAI